MAQYVELNADVKLNQNSVITTESAEDKLISIYSKLEELLNELNKIQEALKE